MTIGINTKATLAYFKHEVTPGVAVVPSNSTDGYFEISEGASIEAAKEVLDSDLISSYIGRAKGQHGLQGVIASCSTEFKAGQSEGVENDFDALLETALGAKSVAAAEFDLIAGSTTTVLKVGVGEGASFEVGEFLLVKEDLGDGYEIGVIKSITDDDLTLEVALSSAPAATTLLGKCVLYKGANSGHKHGTFGLYHGNINRERAAGCLVETLTITIEAGQIIKADFSLNGLNSDYVSASAAAHTPVFMGGEGLVGLDVSCWVAGTKVDFKSATITITNEIKEVLSAKPVSGKVLSRVGARSVEVAMTVYADDASHTNETNYQNLTDFAFVLTAGKKDSSGNYEAGKCIGVYMPNCYWSELPRGEEDNILVENGVIRAHRSTGLNEIFIGTV